MIKQIAPSTSSLDATKFLITGVCWFLSSAAFSTWANTTFLIVFRDPLSHTLVRFWGSAIIGGVALVLKGELSTSEFPTMAGNLLLPAILLWTANYANSIALQAAGITLTYIVKALVPVFTVTYLRLCGQRQPTLVYVSLLPVCFGVALASASDLNFTVFGLTVALVSSLAQTFLNITVKTVRTEKGYSGPRAFFVMTVICSLITLPVATISFNIANGQSMNIWMSNPRIASSPISDTVTTNDVTTTALLNGDTSKPQDETMRRLFGRTDYYIETKPAKLLQIQGFDQPLKVDKGTQKKAENPKVQQPADLNTKNDTIRKHTKRLLSHPDAAQRDDKNSTHSLVHQLQLQLQLQLQSQSLTPVSVAAIAATDSTQNDTTTTLKRPSFNGLTSFFKPKEQANSEAIAVVTVYDVVIQAVSGGGGEGNWRLLLLILLAALAYHIEYSLNFIFVGFVSPVAFSVCDIARRLGIIVSGAFLFNKTLTSLNVLGILIALAGVLWYSVLESAYNSARRSKQSAELETSRNEKDNSMDDDAVTTQLLHTYSHNHSHSSKHIIDGGSDSVFMGARQSPSPLQLHSMLKLNLDSDQHYDDSFQQFGDVITGVGGNGISIAGYSTSIAGGNEESPRSRQPTATSTTPRHPSRPNSSRSPGSTHSSYSTIGSSSNVVHRQPTVTTTNLTSSPRNHQYYDIEGGGKPIPISSSTGTISAMINSSHRRE